MHTTNNIPGPSERGRWTSGRKAEAVMRLLRGEDLDTLSRELNVNASKISEWRDAFLDAGQTSLKTNGSAKSGGGGAGALNDEHVKRLQAKVGELTMDNELLNHKIDAMENNHPLASRRSKR